VIAHISTMTQSAPTQGARHAPTAAGSAIFGLARSMREDGLRTLTSAHQTYGDVVSLDFRVMKATLFAHPDAAEHILLTHSKNYGKQTRGYNVLRGLLGNGLLTSEGSFWLRQRRIASPAFHRDRIASFAETMVRCTDDMLRTWPVAMHTRRFEQDMMLLTMRIAGLTLLSRDTQADGTHVSEALTELLERQTMDRILSAFSFPLSIPTPRNRRFNQARKILDDVIGRSIAERRAGKHEDDLLSMLMQVTDADTGESMTDMQLRDEVMTMFLAGHETTASSLAFTVAALCQAPEALTRVREEVHSVLGEQTPTLENTKSMPYLEAVIEEAMRLYPPVPLVARNAIEADTIMGYKVPKGRIVFVSPWITQRHTAFFPEPNAFRPERFLGDAAKKLLRFAHFPFLGGPRKCIGEGFARLEQKLVLARILQRVQFTLDETVPIQPMLAATLRAKHGVHLHVTRATSGE
jgi:cytochrome P450